MTTYSDVEARAQLLLQGLTSIFPDAGQVTRGDWRPIDSGVDRLAVLYPGGVQDVTTYAAGAKDWRDTMNCDLFQREKHDGQALVDYEAMRDAVLALFQQYPSLNGLAVAVGAITATELGGLFDDSGGGPYFFVQTLSIPVTLLVTVTIAEGG